MPTVAVVGRPNVGKSTLFNKLCGRRLSIVEDTPGVTRDRIFAQCEWLGKEFTLIDTGGLEPTSSDGMLTEMRLQVELAIDCADAIIFVTDGMTGMTATDTEIANLLRRAKKPIFVAVNKLDNIGRSDAALFEFYELAIGDLFAVSAVHGHGTGDLLDAVFEHLSFKENNSEDGLDPITVAIIGRPNVGKSSLVNYILGENRMIVRDEAGTTRDAVDSPVENEFGRFVLIDTAGMRKRGRVEPGVERYSTIRSLSAVDRSEVVVIMLDATVGFTEQDSKIAGYAHEQGKACIIAVNKWDAIEKETKTMERMRKSLMDDFSFMSYVPFIFISAKTGERVPRMFELIKFVNDQNAMRITTGVLNDLLHRATARVQPPSDKGRPLKIYYMTQISTRPPTFAAFCNKKDLFHFSYQRYIENQIREAYGLEGTPIKILIRERGEKV